MLKQQELLQHQEEMLANQQLTNNNTQAHSDVKKFDKDAHLTRQNLCFPFLQIFTLTGLF